MLAQYVSAAPYYSLLETRLYHTILVFREYIHDA